MENKLLDRITSTDLEAIKNGLTRLNTKLHSIPAAYILYLDETGRYYIGSTGNLYQRTYSHVLLLKKGIHPNSSFQKDYQAAKCKDTRISFIRADDRKQAYEIEQLLLNNHNDSGLLYNVFTNAEVNGHGGKWTKEAKAKQSEVGKKNAETGKLKKAWKSTSRAVSINGVKYPSMSEAARQLGISQPTLAWRFICAKKPTSSFHGIYYYTEPADLCDTVM